MKRKTAGIVLMVSVVCGWPIAALGALSGGAVGVADGDATDPVVQPDCRLEIRFSTEVGFTCGSCPDFPFISDGALLSDRVCLVAKNERLMARLGVMPPTPDMGLDAVTLAFSRPVLFSIEQGVWSETLGWLGHGDILSTNGQIVRRNRALLAAFQPVGPCPCECPDGTCDCDCTHADCDCCCCDVGLDAVHAGIASSSDVGFLFSVEHGFWSAALQQWISHGDLLAEAGFVYRSQEELLRNFHPVCPDCPDADCPCDFGLDGVYLTRWGDVWFSVEDSFYDLHLGFIEEGAVLSERGYVVRQNRQLMRPCEPLEDLADFGLDAIDVRTHYHVTPTDSVGDLNDLPLE